MDQAQHVTEKAFSTRFSGLFGESFVDFGPPRAAEMSSIDELVEIPVNQGFFWTSIPQGVRFGPDAANAFTVPEMDAVLTSGSSVSFVPSSISTEFF